MNMRKNIGLRLSQARKVKGLTQEQLAELASFSVSEISRIETWNCSHLHRKKSRRFALKLSSKFTSCRIKI